MGVGQATRLTAFWNSLLAREVVLEASGALLPSDDTQLGLRFLAASTEKSGPNRLHLHLTSTSLEDQQRTVETALSLGGRRLDVGQIPDEGHIVLGDPDGNEICVAPGWPQRGDSGSRWAYGVPDFRTANHLTCRSVRRLAA